MAKAAGTKLRKVVVTGSAGMLGQELVKTFREAFRVWEVDLQQMDVTSLDQTRRVLGEIRPDWIIHAAAYTRVDDAESESREAHRVNALGTRNIAAVGFELGSAVLYYSTDYVFNGESRKPYTEFDAPSPLNEYGRSKLAGEVLLRWLNPRHLVVRTSWLFGPGGPNFVDTIRLKSREGRPLRIVSDQCGSPTYTLDLARMSLELVERGLLGTYHVTNAGHCSWFELADAIMTILKRDVPVVPVSTREFPRPAKRPSFSVLENHMLQVEGISPLRFWKEAVAEHLGNSHV